MSPLLLHPRPARQLAQLGRPPAGVVATGSVGYVDAAEDDRQRWIAGFRALLDGLDTPLQVLIDFVPGSGTGSARDVDSTLPAPADWRGRDLAYAQAIRDSTAARRRDVHFATPLPALDGVERALRDLALPDVRRLEWQPLPGTLFGTEAPAALWDGQGWHRTWWLERFPGGDLVPGWLLRLVPPGLRVTLAWHAERLPTSWVVDYLQRQLVHMRATQMHRADGVGDPLIDGAAPAAELLQRRLTASEESAFEVALYLTLSAASPETLEAGAELVEAAARSALCQLLPATCRQLDGRIATLPVARDPLRRRRFLDTSSLATLFPWSDADLQDPAGLVLGSSRATGQPVLVDPFDDRRYANAKASVFS
jgi:hypothetical protein